MESTLDRHITHYSGKRASYWALFCKCVFIICTDPFITWSVFSNIEKKLTVETAYSPMKVRYEVPFVSLNILYCMSGFCNCHTILAISIVGIHVANIRPGMIQSLEFLCRYSRTIWYWNHITLMRVLPIDLTVQGWTHCMTKIEIPKSWSTLAQAITWTNVDLTPMRFCSLVLT